MTDEEKGEQEKAAEIQPLWPKTGQEWGFLVLDLAVVGMIGAVVGKECPGIPGSLAFIFSFVIVTIIGGLIKFFFSLRREERPALHPTIKAINDIVGLGQLGVGIWGMVLVFPNLGYLSDPGPETCDSEIIICMLIPASIIALVIVGLIGYGIYSLACKKSEEVEAEE